MWRMLVLLILVPGCILDARHRSGQDMPDDEDPRYENCDIETRWQMVAEAQAACMGVPSPSGTARGWRQGDTRAELEEQYELWCQPAEDGCAQDREEACTRADECQQPI